MSRTWTTWRALIATALVAGCGGTSSDAGRGDAAGAVFITYLGGSRYEQARDIAVDPAGNVYVTGGTESPDFPVTAGAFQQVHNPGTPESSAITRMDVFVAKYSPGGTLLWATLLGGPNYDRAYAIEVDGDGQVVVAGRAGRGFPVTRGAAQTQFMGGTEAAFYGPQDGFVAKLSADGRKLLWATYFGGSDPYIIRDMDVDASGNVYVGATTESGSAKPPGWLAWFADGYLSSPPGGFDAVLAKMAADGSRVLWASYLGGSGLDAHLVSPPSVRVDAAGVATITFGTASKDVETSAGAYQPDFRGGESDVFVARLSADGARLVFGTYLGGSGNDGPAGAHGLALDGDGNAYISGFTRSADFPTTPGAMRTKLSHATQVDGFVAKLAPDGTRLLRATFTDANGEGVAVDARQNVYYTGGTSLPGLPVTSNAVQRNLIGGGDGFAVKLSADFGRYLYATYLGGGASNANDSLRAIAVDSAGNILAAGTAAPDWPVLNAYQASFGGNGDVPVVKLVPGPR
jgi:hypothetical protein